MDISSFHITYKNYEEITMFDFATKSRFYRSYAREKKMTALKYIRYWNQADFSL